MSQLSIAVGDTKVYMWERMPRGIGLVTCKSWWGVEREEGVDDDCHRYDFLVYLWNGLNFFELFKLLFSLGIDHDPPYFLCSHDLCLFLSLMFHSSHDHMAKRSHPRIMSFWFWSTTILRTHLHPRFLLFPPQPHHPYTPRLCRSTTDWLGEGYPLDEPYGPMEDPVNT